MTKIKFILIFLLASLTMRAEEVLKTPSKSTPTFFAIVVDEQTYLNTDGAVDVYKESVENDGLGTYILVNDWKNPQQVKDAIVKLYKEFKTLEGVVFIGDIPIPMISDAKHLTSSDKLDRSTYGSLKRNSVPSDRFYDDFDLKFRYLNPDKRNSLYHYYSLLPDSPQKIEREIYSARIKPSEGGVSKYEKIKNYLLKVAELKKVKNPLDNALVFTGYGYHSESITSWSDEQLSLKEEFPQLFKPGGKLKKLNHTMNNYSVKDMLLRELQEKDLDLAIFHAHGDEDVQYLNKDAAFSKTQDQIEAVKKSLRNKVRESIYAGNSAEKAIDELSKKYDAPKEWFEGTFDHTQIVKDSADEYSKNIYIKDIRKIAPQPKFIIFDQCYNGAFHEDKYIAGEYIFGNGNSVAGIGNSTTVLQDQWSGEFIGLLSYGVRFGVLHKKNNMLESHLIGDPTFHFESVSDLNVNNLITLNTNNVEFWQKMLSSNSIPLRNLAIFMLYKNYGNTYEKDLQNYYLNEESVVIRFHSLKYLAEINSTIFEELLKISINDPFEYIRRISAVWMGKVGREEYIPLMAKQLISDESERVIFNLRRSIVLIDPEAAYHQVSKEIDNIPVLAQKNDLKDHYKKIMLNSNKWLNEELLANIKDDTAKPRKKVKEAVNFRIYNFIQAVPELVDLAKSNKEESVTRVAILDALGYYGFAHNREIIISGCDEIIKDSKTPKSVKQEALKTKNRILAGLNNPLTS